MFSFIARMLVSTRKGVFLDWLLGDREHRAPEGCACQGKWFDHDNVTHSDHLCAKSSFSA